MSTKWISEFNVGDTVCHKMDPHKKMIITCVTFSTGAEEYKVTDDSGGYWAFGFELVLVQTGIIG